MTGSDRRAYTRRSVAARYGISLRKLDELVAEGSLRSLKIGTRRVFTDEHLAEFESTHETA